MMEGFLFLFFYFIFILFSSGLLTMYERFLLALSQIRSGPLKTSFLGVFQMIFDGIKLIFSELLVLKVFSNFFFFSPILSFFLVFILFLFPPFFFNLMGVSYSFIFFFLIIGFLVFSFLLVSFFSKSKFSFLGTLRISSGALSFDMVFIFFSFYFFLIYKKFLFTSYFFLFFFLFFLSTLISLLLIELNRAPFDFAEGESELVSGFNTELGGVSFTLVFLSEYSLLIFYSVLLSYLLGGGSMIFGFFIFFFLVFIRSCFPRYRYDFLMSLCWLIFLPVLILFFISFFCFFI